MKVALRRLSVFDLSMLLCLSNTPGQHSLIYNKNKQCWEFKIRIISKWIANHIYFYFYLLNRIWYGALCNSIEKCSIQQKDKLIILCFFSSFSLCSFLFKHIHLHRLPFTVFFFKIGFTVFVLEHDLMRYNDKGKNVFYWECEWKKSVKTLLNEIEISCFCWMVYTLQSTLYNI